MGKEKNHEIYSAEVKQMIDDKFFLRNPRDQVQALNQGALVRVTLHSGGEYFVRDVVQTRPGYVSLNVFHGHRGQPIVAVYH